jgi:uncharacterized spore protein YtfJ
MVDMDLENLLAKAGENLSVHRAFGTAYDKDGLLIIPVALVAGGGGGGTARSRHDAPAVDSDSSPEKDGVVDEATSHDSGRTDAGGGFGALVLPAGVYVVKGDQVRWVPSVDTTIVVLASLILARIVARTWARSRRYHSGP